MNVEFSASTFVAKVTTAYITLRDMYSKFQTTPPIFNL